MKHLITEYYKIIKYPLKELQQQKVDDYTNKVYVFFNPLNGLCKIGITRNVNERIMALQNQSGMILWHVITIVLKQGYDESAKSVKNFIHKFFKEKRQKGEWFKLNIKDILMIRQLFFEIYGEDIDDDLKKCVELYKSLTFY